MVMVFPMIWIKMMMVTESQMPRKVSIKVMYNVQEARYIANTKSGRVGSGGNEHFYTFQLDTVFSLISAPGAFQIEKKILSL